MKRQTGTTRLFGGALTAWLAVGALLWGGIGTAAASDVEELLTQVGEEYAVGYSSPFLYSYGPNVNSNLFSTASVPWNRIVFGIGVKAMGTRINESDQSFAKVIEDVDLGVYNPAFSGFTGDVYLSGPTIFGDTETNGIIQGFVGGAEVFRTEAIPGLVDTRWSPTVAPEAYIGGVAGLKLTLRYLPEIDTGDYGKTKYFGYGLSWNANGVLQNLPVDVMAGFFIQNFDVGTIYDSKATAMYVAASKSYTMLTVYGGFALEDSEMDVSYVYENPDDPSQTAQVDFTVEGQQDTRFTLGVTLDILAKLNVEAGFGNQMTTFSAGLMFGL